MDDRHINGPMDLARLSWMLMRKGTARILRGLREVSFGLVDLGYGLLIRKGTVRVLRGLRDVLFGLVDLSYGLLIPWLFCSAFVFPLALSFAKSSPEHGDAIATTVFVIGFIPFAIVMVTTPIGTILWMTAKVVKWWRSRSRAIDRRGGPVS